eukprot:scaffold18794_cov31-Prasinocladus_malaysianus.AAC.1
MCLDIVLSMYGLKGGTTLKDVCKRLSILNASHHAFQTDPSESPICVKANLWGLGLQKRKDLGVSICGPEQ